MFRTVLHHLSCQQHSIGVKLRTLIVEVLYVEFFPILASCRTSAAQQSGVSVFIFSTS